MATAPQTISPPPEITHTASSSQPPPSVARSWTSFRPAKITPLGTPFQHALHAYQGLCPWSPGGDKLLYCGFDEIGQDASIVMREISTGADEVIGKTGHYDFHTAAYQQWALGGDAVVFRTTSAGNLGTALSRVTEKPAHTTFLPGVRIRAMAAKGVCGYGHFNVGDGDGAARMNLVSSEVEHYFSAGEAASHLPSEWQEECPFSISHFVPNAAETLAFFKVSKPEPHRRIEGSLPDWGGFFVHDLINRTFHYLGQRISGHPQWMPDDRHIINVMQPLDGSDNRWIVRQDALTGEVERVVDFAIEGAGHPVISPCGRYLATDAYTADRQTCPVYLVDLATGQMSEIARFAHSTKITDRYQPHTILRANLHPVWSPDGQQLLVNANEGGMRLGMYLLDGFLT